jgi:hypothetical protein
MSVKFQGIICSSDDDDVANSPLKNLTIMSVCAERERERERVRQTDRRIFELPFRT